MAHIVGTRRQTVVTHVDLNDIVIGKQVAGENAEVIQAAEQTVDGRWGIIVQVLCSLRSKFNFIAKFFFSRIVGLGYHVEHSNAQGQVRNSSILPCPWFATRCWVLT